MLEFNGAAFYQATTAMAQLRVHLADKKSIHEQPDGGLLIEPVDNPVVLAHLSEGARTLRESLSVLGAKFTLLVVDRLLAEMSDHPTWERMAALYRDIDLRLRDELASVQLLVVAAEDQDYFAPHEPIFGSAVAEAFPSIVYDMDEAGKCLALERGTASTFHSIRCLEASIRALSRCLGIDDPTRAADRNWAGVLTKIHAAIEQRWKTVSERTGGDGMFFEQSYALLVAMRNPYRNSTMHLDQKYTVEEARHILEVVNGFMRKLASRLNEEGAPKLPALSPA